MWYQLTSLAVFRASYIHCCVITDLPSSVILSASMTLLLSSFITTTAYLSLAFVGSLWQFNSSSTTAVHIFIITDMIASDRRRYFYHVIFHHWMSKPCPSKCMHVRLSENILHEKTLKNKLRKKRQITVCERNVHRSMKLCMLLEHYVYVWFLDLGPVKPTLKCLSFCNFHIVHNQ